MRAYYISYEFYYDDKLRGTYSYDTLTDCPPLAGEILGDDFERLWALAVEYGIRVPLCLWDKRGKRSMEIFDTFVRITPRNCKPWKLVINVEETTISMEKLMRYDADKVVRYIADILKNNGGF